MKPNKIRVAHYDGKSLFYPHRSLLFCDRIASLLVSQRLLVMLLQLFLFLSGPKFEQHYMVQSFTYTTTGSSFHSTKKWNTLVIPHRNMMGDTKLDQEGKEEDAGNNQGNKIDNSTVEQSMYPDVIPVSGMKVNDGGSNLTDRFKYKVVNQLLRDSVSFFDQTQSFACIYLTPKVFLTLGECTDGCFCKYGQFCIPFSNQTYPVNSYFSNNSTLYYYFTHSSGSDRQ